MPEEYRVISQEGEKAHWHIFPGLCKGCGLCLEMCPVDILFWSDELGVYATPIAENRDVDQCTGCGMCMIICPDAAIRVEKKSTKTVRKNEEKNDESAKGKEKDPLA